MVIKLLKLLTASLLLSFSATSHAMSGLTDLTGAPAGFENRLDNGKWLVVMFWAHDCHVCNREVHEYEALHFRGDDLNLEVIGVSLDGVQGLANARAFVDRHQLTFENFVGDYENVAKQFLDQTGQWLAGTPGFIVYGTDGAVRDRHLGALPAQVVEEFVTR